jgi:hypothetical protein
MNNIVKDFIQGVVLGGVLMLGYILLTNYLGV